MVFHVDDNTLPAIGNVFREVKHQIRPFAPFLSTIMLTPYQYQDFLYVFQEGICTTNIQKSGTARFISAYLASLTGLLSSFTHIIK